MVQNDVSGIPIVSKCALDSPPPDLVDLLNSLLEKYFILDPMNLFASYLKSFIKIFVQGQKSPIQILPTCDSTSFLYSTHTVMYDYGIIYPVNIIQFVQL